MKKILNDKIIYGAYFRKSSESEDRQAQSIPDQIREVETIAQRENIQIGIKFPGESQSAFTIGRPIFADLVNKIMDQEINAIVVWHPNRLARNPVDAGMILYLLDEGKLKVIQTPSRAYYNTASDKFMLQLEFSMSKKDSDDKSEAVIRGLEGRAIRGLPSGVSKVGFLNDTTEEKGKRKWNVDKIRFPLVQQLLKKMLTGKYSPAQIYRYAKDDLKLTTTPRKKVGGKAISFSYIYLLLRDPIYAGFFFYDEKRYELDDRLPRAITEDEYWKIQTILGLKGRPHPSKHEGTYNDFLVCKKCNGHMSPDFKFQLICSVCRHKFSYRNTVECPKCKTKIEQMIDPVYCSYVYYYCINNKKHRTVCQNDGIEEKKLQQALVLSLKEKVSISKDLSKWCIDNIYKLKDIELNEKLSIKNNLDQEELSLKTKLKKITLARISREVSLEEEQTYIELENEIRAELVSLNIQKGNMNVEWFSEASKDFDLMSEIVNVLENGTTEQKKETLYAFGSNLTVKDKIVSVHNKKSIELFSEFLERAQIENKAFEPRNTLATKEKTEVFASVIPILLRG